MSLFSLKGSSSVEELTRRVGLQDLMPGAILDAKIFDPCGYSLNAIVQVCVRVSVCVCEHVCGCVHVCVCVWEILAVETPADSRGV